jgi:hypothetical protein
MGWLYHFRPVKASICCIAEQAQNHLLITSDHGESWPQKAQEAQKAQTILLTLSLCAFCG